MPKEDPKERLDRELIELLNELRVALPGVQVLFAFLLTVPFSDRFTELTDPQRDVYFAAFLCTAVSSVCLMAPTAYHRIRFRQADKEHMLRSANLLAIVGIAFLALATALVVFVVTDLLFKGKAAGIATGVVSAALIVIWFGLPISRRIADEED
jgi:hypothetical protein